jgi:hypothetical protein
MQGEPQMHRFVAFVGTTAIVASSALAQTAVQWTSVAKRINGNCQDGAVAEVSELPGKMNVKIFIEGKQNSQFDVPLHADGSGSVQYKTSTGRRLIAEIPPGKGKRSMKLSQLDTTCQWELISK